MWGQEGLQAEVTGFLYPQDCHDLELVLHYPLIVPSRGLRVPRDHLALLP